jgi:hypothetical protein
MSFTSRHPATHRPLRPCRATQPPANRATRSSIQLARATSSALPSTPSDSTAPPPENVEWDPEGLLPPVPAGGHFQRRGEALPGDQQPTAPLAFDRTSSSIPNPRAAALSPLLQPAKSKKAGRRSGGAAIGAAVTTPPVVPPTNVPEAAPRRTPFAEVPTAPEQGIGATIEAAFQETFWGAAAAPRVLESFRLLRSGAEHEEFIPGKGLQRAGSYVAGLRAEPFPDLHCGAYPWLVRVEEQAAIIQQEFAAAMAQGEEALKEKGRNVWVPAARDDALSYGPDWRTWVLQDRGVWEETNSSMFPQTRALFESLNAPTLEVFFARQQGRTGIAPHTDNANFVQTSHLGIDVPEGRCWIKVGEFTEQWRNGKVIVCDTSFIHETMNEADEDRYVLIMRHWHPEMSLLERAATQFLFRCLDDPTTAGIKAAQKAASKELKALGSGTGGTAGFGGKKSKGKKGGGKSPRGFA